MNVLDVCTGMAAATQAWRPLGFKAIAYSEIDPAPCALLAHHYPETPNWGDMTKFKEWPDAAVDVLVGGTPCQSFSIAGLRKGLADPRGNLMLTYLGILDRYRPRWMVWENVPGVLSSNGGRDFGTFLGAMGELGYGWAYRSLDAQYFNLAQRRERVFVVGCLGDWRGPAEVLLERESLCGYPAPRRETRKDVAPTLSARTQGGGGLGTDFDLDGGRIVGTLDASYGRLQGCSGQDASHGHSHLVFSCKDHGAPVVTHSLRADGFDASEDGTGRGTPLVPVAFNNTGEGWWNEAQSAATIRKEDDAGAGGARESTLVAFSCKDHGADAGELSPTLRAMGHDGSHANAGGQVAVAHTLMGYSGRNKIEATYIPEGWAVRRLTPRECSRLQGFPDDYLEICYANASQAHTAQVLHELWSAATTFAREGWRSGVAASLLTEEILLTGVYVGWLSWEMASRCAAARGTLPSSQPWPEGFVRALRLTAERRPTPYRRESFEQCARELGRPLSKVPYETPQAQAALLHSRLWETAQAQWPLRYAFTTSEGRSPKSLADGPRYKMLGNSMAVPCMAWIGKRIAAVASRG